MDGDRRHRLRTEDERGERSLDHEERRKGDAAQQRALAAARDGDRHEQVREGEDERGPANAFVLLEDRFVRGVVVEDAVDDEENGREQHEDDDRAHGASH